MSHPAHIDFDSVSRSALQQVNSLLPRWFPAGRFLGREFVVGDLSGTPGESLSINTHTGQWADFSTDDRGGDLISLFAAMRRVRQVEAAKELATILGGDASDFERASARVTPMPIPESPEWNGIFPIPADAPSPPSRHPTHGAPTHKAEYRDRHGRVIALIYRCEPDKGKAQPHGQAVRKQVVPLTFCENLKTGKREWRWQSLPKPRALYCAELLDQRPKARILLVEGEPKCDAANKLFASHIDGSPERDIIAMSWLGGAKAWKHVDWSMLAGRQIVIWPDADQPGTDAAKQIAAQLSTHHRAKVRVLDLPKHAPQGWDVGDAIRDGWQFEMVMAFVDPPKNPLPLVYFDDIKPCLDTTDFVEGLLMEASAIVLYGESNSGKTFFATDLGLHIAAGLTWRNKEVLQGGVVYVAMEGSVGFNNRVEAWRKHFDVETKVVFAAIPAVVNLLDPDADTPRLIDAVRQASINWDIPVKLIIIDTLSRAMAGGNENAPDDMGALVMNMDAIRAATSAAVMFIHHSGKDQAKGARGHSLLRAAIDTEIEVIADEESPAKTATVVKQRELQKGDQFGFQLKIVELGENSRGKPVTSCLVEHSGEGQAAGAAPVQRRLPQHQQRALEVLMDLVAEKGQGGYAGTPAGIPSVPEKWWRDRFYDRAVAGADPDTKKRAFRRAADALVSESLVGMSAGRVWPIKRKMGSGLAQKTGNSDADARVASYE